MALTVRRNCRWTTTPIGRLNLKLLRGYHRRRMGKSHSNQSITRHAVNKFDSKLGVDGRACDLSERRTFGSRTEENFISIPAPS